VRSFTRFKQVGSGENNRKIGTGHKGRRCICESRKAASVSDTSSKAEEGRSLAGSARPLLTTHRWQLFVHGYAMISSQVPVIGICGNAFEWNSWFRVAEWLLVLCQGEFDVWLVRPVRDWDMPLYTHEVSMASSRIPAGIQSLLQTGNLGQSLCVPDQVLDTLSFLIGQLDARDLVSAVGIGC
jgi:hypothetical protein